MTSIGYLIAPAILVGALCLFVGAKQIGTRLIVGSIALAVLLPVALCSLGQMPIVSLTRLASILGWALGAVAVIALVAGWIAFVKQRRALAKWREPDEPSQSVKQRSERL